MPQPQEGGEKSVESKTVSSIFPNNGAIIPFYIYVDIHPRIK